MKTFPKLNIYDKALSIYDRDVQDKLISELDGTSADSKTIFETFEDMISLHSQRRAIQLGMWNRSKLKPASRFEVSDPRTNDGVPIFARPNISDSKENHKLHTAFDKKIVTNKAAYIAGQAPNVTAEDNMKLFYDGTGFDNKLMELLQAATRGGNGYALAVSPEGQNEAYISLVNEWQCISLYDINTGALKYSLRYYPDVDIDNISSNKWTVELYTTTEKHSYTYNGSWEYKNTIQHLFDGVPLVEFANNTERLGDVELTTSLQDAYDILQSDLSSEITQLRLAYLSLDSEEIDVDEEWLNTLKQTGIFIGKGEFLEKNLNSQTVESLKADLERQIYEYSNSYDPSSLGSSGDITAYQIKQKLFGLEMSASETIKMFTDSVDYLFGLLGAYLKKFKSISNTEIEFTFRRNIPSNNLEDLKMAVESGFKVSQGIMSSLMPFEINQEENEKQLAEESSMMAIDDPFGDSALPTGDTEEAVEVAKLSGIQISSANEIISQVARGELDRAAGINQLKVFLGLSDEQAQQVMGSGKAIKVTKIEDAEA